MKAQVSTIITMQLSYDRYDNFIKTKTFEESEPITNIKKWIDCLKEDQLQGTCMSNVNIEFIDED